MVDTFEIQTEAQVKAIENRKIINDALTTNNINTTDTAYIEQQISDINDSISTIDSVNFDELSAKIDDIDINVLRTQINDVLIKIQNQQEQINNIEEQIDSIEEKIDMIIEKI